MAKLFLFNKPYGVLSQFTDSDGRETLGQYLKTPRIYPAGRLDQDSEGLLLLTGEGKLQHQIAHPKHKLPKTYWVQVEGTPEAGAIETLKAGVLLKDGKTRPAKARVIEEPKIWPRNPPIRKRAAIATTWLELVITEGKNRQVRRMTAAVGHPTLRLVRAKIGNWSLGTLQPGEYTVKDVHVPVAAESQDQKTRPNRSRKQSPPIKPGKKSTKGR